jgi:hypothetical protein
VQHSADPPATLSEIIQNIIYVKDMVGREVRIDPVSPGIVGTSSRRKSLCDANVAKAI